MAVVLDQKAAAKAELNKKKDDAALEIRKKISLGSAGERERAKKVEYTQSAINCCLSSQLMVERTNSVALKSQLMVEQK
jgi:hypothetical protein